jgi:hypothetical protein
MSSHGFGVTGVSEYYLYMRAGKIFTCTFIASVILIGTICVWGSND